jgi:hypothetical protein
VAIPRPPSFQYGQQLIDIFQHSIGSVEIAVPRQIRGYDDAADAGCPGGFQPARGILDRNARLRRQAAALDGAQVRFGVRLDAPEVAGRQYKVEVLEQPGVAVDDVEVVLPGAGDHSHHVLAV